MSETLEEAKQEYIEKHVSRNEYASFGEAFIAGAEWQAKQSPWISIDDSFPEDNAVVLCSSSIYGKVVLRWDELSQEWLYPEENHIYCDWDKVDCWMLIPEV